MCSRCGCRKVALGCHKYCRECSRSARTDGRRKRREQLKAQDTPVWQRNGWASVEQYRQYHRRYMRELRARAREDL